MLKSLKEKLLGNNRKVKPRPKAKIHRKLRPQMEALEDRSLLSVSATMASGGVLQVTGTEQADHIQVFNYGPYTIVYNNGAGIYGVNSLSINSISVDARGGDDHVQVIRVPYYTGNYYSDYMYNQRPIPTTLNGGFGDDTLVGGYDADKMYGGYDNDELSGGGGRDTLDGGFGDDTLKGGSGNDTLRGSYGNDVLNGDAHADYLDGGGDNDEIHGGSGNDELQGGFGDDSLYGGDGNDTLKGSFGDDGLFGGKGFDELYGGFNDDRFLVWHGEFTNSAWHTVHDKGSSDAVIRFKLGNEEWTSDEIELVDKALAILHRATENTALLNPTNGKDMTFVRNDGLGAGSNNDERIILTDWVLNPPASSFPAGFDAEDSELWTIGYTLHEIGHYWDEESPIWNDFLELSDWTQTNPNSAAFTRINRYGETWWYRTNSAFTDDYAQTHPAEDFCQSFAAYFLDYAGLDWYDPRDPAPTGAGAISDKVDLIEDWVDTL